MPHLKDLAHFSLAVLGLVAGLLLAGAQLLQAQEAGPSPEPFRLPDPSEKYVTKSWSVQDGLPLNLICGLEQTQDGLLWIGTLDGLARFDGHSFTTYTAANAEGLAGNRIFGLHEEASGTLWIGTSTGVSTYRDGQFRSVAGASGHVEHFGEGPDGTVWMGGTLDCTGPRRRGEWPRCRFRRPSRRETSKWRPAAAIRCG